MKTINIVHALALATLLFSGVSVAAAADYAPVITMPGAGTMLRGGEFEVLASAKQTGGEFSLVIINNQPGPGHPINSHTRESETFYVLEGQYRFTIGDKVIEGGPGTVVVNPPNVPHTFESITPGKVLAIYTPGGFDEFFADWDASGVGPGPGLAPIEAQHGIVYK